MIFGRSQRVVTGSRDQERSVKVALRFQTFRGKVIGRGLHFLVNYSFRNSRVNLRTQIPAYLTTAFAFLAGKGRRKCVEPRERWGKEVARDRDMDRIGLYHRTLECAQAKVDERTWQDLGMDDLFAKLDRTVGMPGAQLLYHQLRTYEENDLVLTERARQQGVFKKDTALREKILPLLARLNKSGAVWIAPLLLNPIPELPRYAWLLYLSSGLSLGCLIGTVLFPPLLIGVLLLFLVNMLVNATYGTKITPYFYGFSQIDPLLGVGSALGRITEGAALPQLNYLKENAALIAGLKNKFGWVAIDRTAQNELVQSLYEYLNNLFLFDVLIFLRSLKNLREHREVLSRIWGEVASLDASLSVASYAAGVGGVTVPTLVDARRLEVAGLYHPLLSSPVGNELSLNDRSALVSGSNMAGKTTFIRTVGINLILARTLAICHAQRAVFPRAMVRSAIRREDQLSDGQSYFFAELKQIQEFIVAAESGPLHLFLLDEIFRGTNTIERISASTAVLRNLSRRQMVLVTTHDIELQELLKESFDMGHFSERFEEGECRFDYRLQPGPAHSRNAIKLLGISGYPQAITQEAELIAAQLSAQFERRSGLG